MRHTLVDNTSRWTLSFPNFDLVPGVFDNLTACFDHHFPGSRRKDFLG